MFAKLSAFAFNKISFLIYEKYSHSLMGFEALDYIAIHKKSPRLPSSAKFVQHMEAKSGELRDQDATKGSGLSGQWGALN